MKVIDIFEHKFVKKINLIKKDVDNPQVIYIFLHTFLHKIAAFLHTFEHLFIYFYTKYFYDFFDFRFFNIFIIFFIF